MLFDSDVLIWHLRGNKSATTVINSQENLEISVVNYMEVIQGVRNKRELTAMRGFLKDLGFRMVPLTENIGSRAALYMEGYALKTRLSLTDALVAATAVETQSVLCSGNTKHYRLIEGLELKQFRPS